MSSFLAYIRRCSAFALLALIALHPQHLAAQDERIHIGIMGSMAFPTGEFGGNNQSRDSYYDYGRNRVPGFGSAFGGAIFVGLPVTDHITVRPNGSYFRFRGDEGDNWGYQPTPMTLELSSYGCDVQFLFGYPGKHSRGYVFVGAAADSEKLAIGGQAYTDSAPDHYAVKRNAMNIGFGRIMHRDGASMLLELGYHRTLSGDMPAGLQMPGSDYWRISFGTIF